MDHVVEAGQLPESLKPLRQPGRWKDRVWFADDYEDDLPLDMWDIFRDDAH